MSDKLKKDSNILRLRALALDVAGDAAIKAAFTAYWGFGRSEDDGSLEQSCWDDGLAAFTAGLMWLRNSTALPTPAPGQCPMCGEYSMSARAHQGLYGVKVDL